jgi:hypothetical protein
MVGALARVVGQVRATEQPGARRQVQIYPALQYKRAHQKLAAWQASTADWTAPVQTLAPSSEASKSITEYA